MPSLSGEGEQKKAQKNKAYILYAQKTLLQHMLAPWSRRETTLLEINCGDGTFSRVFWKSGFDIFATEADSALRRKAFARNIAFREMRACFDNDLPFEENRFDWVALHIIRSERDMLEQAVREAARVCSKGLIITFWNRLSLAGLAAKACHKDAAPFPANGVSCRKIWKLAKNIGEGRLYLRSTLGAPVSAWNFGCPFAFLNERLSFLPFGAWAILRIDFGALRPLTPLPLKVFNPLSRPQEVLEFRQEP